MATIPDSRLRFPIHGYDSRFMATIPISWLRFPVHGYDSRFTATLPDSRLRFPIHGYDSHFAATIPNSWLRFPVRGYDSRTRLQLRTISSTKPLPKQLDALKVAPCSHIRVSCSRPSGATNVTSHKSSNTGPPELPVDSSCQARSSSSTQGPEILPASLRIAVLPPSSTVIFNIVRS